MIIKHLTGPLAGTEQRIPPKLDRVVFGRSIDCEVIYPPDETNVSRHHFALVRKASGDWTADLFGRPFVAINGIPADPGMAISTGSTIELGKRGGPSFQCILQPDRRIDNLPLTEVQEKAEGPRLVALRARLIAGTARKIAVIGLGVGVLAAAGATFYFRQTISESARLERAISESLRSRTRVAGVQFDAGIRSRLARSVYLVSLRDAQNRERGVGTAWPISARLLATNAHVAEVMEKLGEGETMVVREPGENGKTYKVVSHTIHPAYKVFQNFVEADPLYLESFRGKNQVADLNSAYDVALLQVAGELPADSQLQLAEKDDLKALSVGDAIATVGYPMEGISGSLAQVISPSPEGHVGSITGLTDFFYLPADFEHSRLIHHDLPAVGGQSGSPIIGATGRVIALLNAGNIVLQGSGDRAPSAALINYGQRADLLRDILPGAAGSQLATEQKYWMLQTAHFKRGFDLIVPEILARSKPRGYTTTTLVDDLIFNLSEKHRARQQDGSFHRLAGHALVIERGTPYLFLAYARETVDIQLYLSANDKIIAQETDMKWFPAISIRPSATAQATVWTVSPADRDVSYRLQIYKWQRSNASD
jgi:S1-C subfamily serine protease